MIYDYASATPPAVYACTGCGAHGCKLWREYQTCADSIALVCCDCAGKSQKIDVSEIDADGKVALDPAKYGGPGQRSDTIGWRVPAVPTPDGDTFWGYTSVPPDGVAWWKRLPTRVAPRAHAALTRAMFDALDAIDEGLGYTEQYFRDKWGMDAERARLAALLDQHGDPKTLGELKAERAEVLALRPGHGVPWAGGRDAAGRVRDRSGHVPRVLAREERLVKLHDVLIHPVAPAVAWSLVALSYVAKHNAGAASCAALAGFLNFILCLTWRDARESDAASARVIAKQRELIEFFKAAHDENTRALATQDAFTEAIVARARELDAEVVRLKAERGPS